MSRRTLILGGRWETVMTIKFLDCEASSLDADSWPVEAGVA